MAATTVIFVSYNSAQRIGDALRSAKASHDAGVLDCIVVDNASADGTADLVKREHPWAKLIESPVNLGYGRGLNVGLKVCNTPYILFMNPDAVLPTEALRTLVAYLEAHPKAGMVAPAIIEGDMLQEAGALPTPWRILAQSIGLGRQVTRQRPIVPHEPPFTTDWLCGAIMLTRTDLMRELNGFDPRFFLYFEETDLCRRILQRGLELWAVGDAVAHHVGGASARTLGQKIVRGCIPEYYYPSRFYYFVKHHGWPAAACAEIAEFLSLTINRVIGRDLEGLSARMRAPLLRMPAKEVG
ncbi:MAG TPA: glycosyltransferase family 2 protein [Tepidisphaeraceae bacterium]|jgi:hypothetical protein|nr:glycosyltransferase family 2 protein [Tepidisphaeraceae bacterium]